MNKIRLVLYSFVLSLILPCFCMAAQEGSGGMSLAKILAVVLIVVFILIFTVIGGLFTLLSPLIGPLLVIWFLVVLFRNRR